MASRGVSKDNGKRRLTGGKIGISDERKDIVVTHTAIYSTLPGKEQSFVSGAEERRKRLTRQGEGLLLSCRPRIRVSRRTWLRRRWEDPEGVDLALRT